MALKNKQKNTSDPLIKVNFQWRLFIPLTVLVWVLIFTMMGWHAMHERDVRIEGIKARMDYINKRILFERDVDSDIFMLFKFLGSYYTKDPVFKELRVSVYDTRNGTLIYSLGTPIPFDNADRYVEGYHDLTSSEERYVSSEPQAQENALQFMITHSADDKVVVYSAVPRTDAALSSLMPSSNIWLIVSIIALGITIISYFSTRYLTKTIRLLRTFSVKAAADPKFMVDEVEFPNDEVGDVGRQIIHIFNDRAKAFAESERDHQITLKTIEERNAMKRRMTSNISHELKTPVCIVKGYIDTIIDNPDMPERSRNRFIKKAQDNINRMDTLIKDMSTLNRFDEGNDLIPTEPIDFYDAVITVEDENEETGFIGTMKFVNGVPQGTWVNGNFSLLVAMLHNLAKNAVNYSHGSELGVRLDSEDESMYYFTFYDNGTGVGEEHIQHLFERFYCVDSGRARKSCGTGLGLPIVRDTVTFHKGTITVENGAEGGLLFHFSLPKCSAPAKPSNQPGVSTDQSDPDNMSDDNVGTTLKDPDSESDFE